MKLLIYKNNKWHSLVMKWNYKAKEKPRIELKEEKSINILKLLKLKKDTKSATACVKNEKIIAFKEKNYVTKRQNRTLRD